MTSAARASGTPRAPARRAASSPRRSRVDAAHARPAADAVQAGAAATAWSITAVKPARASPRIDGGARVLADEVRATRSTSRPGSAPARATPAPTLEQRSATTRRTATASPRCTAPAPAAERRAPTAVEPATRTVGDGGAIARPSAAALRRPSASSSRVQRCRCQRQLLRLSAAVARARARGRLASRDGERRRRTPPPPSRRRRRPRRRAVYVARAARPAERAAVRGESSRAHGADFAAAARRARAFGATRARRGAGRMPLGDGDRQGQAREEARRRVAARTAQRSACAVERRRRSRAQTEDAPLLPRARRATFDRSPMRTARRDRMSFFEAPPSFGSAAARAARRASSSGARSAARWVSRLLAAPEGRALEEEMPRTPGRVVLADARARRRRRRRA